MGDGWSSFLGFGFWFWILDGGDGGEGRRTEKKKERGGVKRGKEEIGTLKRKRTEVLLKKRR